LNVTHYYNIIFISECTVYADHLKKLSVDEREYKYYDLPSLDSGYGKYERDRERERKRVCVCMYLYIHRMSNVTHKLLTESAKQLKQCTLTFCII